jgi:hypothetical protein
MCGVPRSHTHTQLTFNSNLCGKRNTGQYTRQRLTHRHTHLQKRKTTASQHTRPVRGIATVQAGNSYLSARRVDGHGSRAHVARLDRRLGDARCEGSGSGRGCWKTTRPRLRRARGGGGSGRCRRCRGSDRADTLHLSGSGDLAKLRPSLTEHGSADGNRRWIGSAWIRN